MFKKLQWKIVAMFVLIVLSVMMIAGTFLLTRVSDFYHNQFSFNMQAVFEDEWLMDQLSLLAGEPSGGYQISEIVNAYTGTYRLGISSNRHYFILNGKTGEFIDGSDTQTGGMIEKTPNIIAAMSGKVGSTQNPQAQYMDYAVPVFYNNEPAYIVYVKDNKSELTDILNSLFWIIIQVLSWGVVISLAFGVFLSATITRPIVSLTRRAERLAAGELSEAAPIKKVSDEIGILSNTFSFMSKELYKTIEQVEEEKTKMEAILVNLADGVIAFNLDGHIIHINPAAKEMLSIYNPENVDFNTFFEDISANINLGDIVYLEPGKTFERTIVLNGRFLKAYFATFKSAGRDFQGDEKPAGVVVALQDITEREKLDIGRREFVANVSHELRTPLTTIKSYTETLLDSNYKQDSMEKHFLEVINSEADRMTRIVKDLLTLSKLDHGRQEIVKRNVDLKKLIEGVVEKLAFEAKSRGQTLTFAATTNIPQYKGDKDKLEQVLINLVTNALKYTQDGGVIELYAGKVYNEIYIKVKDNGIGIPAADQKRIFERFYRVDKARTRAAGGTGLGLAIAKEIIVAHGGKITLNSKSEKGTEVIITLPLL